MSVSRSGRWVYQSTRRGELSGIVERIRTSVFDSSEQWDQPNSGDVDDTDEAPLNVEHFAHANFPR